MKALLVLTICVIILLLMLLAKIIGIDLLANALDDFERWFRNQ